MTNFTKAASGLLATVLWIAAVVIAIAEIVMMRELLMRLYTWVLVRSGAVLDVYGTEFWAGVNLRNWIVVLLAIGVLVFAVATGEYHARHVGTRASWMLFAWTFLVQLLVFTIAYFV
jgi:hypothetical protein